MNPLVCVRSPLSFLLLSLLALTVGACGSSTDTSDQSATPEANRKKWKAAAISDYRFTFNWSCFCITDYVRPVRITVSGGKITQIAYADDGLPVDPERWEDYRTIDQLFDFLEEARAEAAFQLNAEYNPVYGYPENAYVDYSQQMADEEKGFRITEFEVLS